MKFCSHLFAGLFATIVFVASARYSAVHSSEPDAAIRQFLSRYCIDCHGPASPAAALDLTSLPQEFGNPEFSRRWVRIFDRVSAGEMPPAKSDPPPAADRTAFTDQLRRAIIDAELGAPTGQLRRLSRSEYENTIRDLFDMPGIALAANLPADGESHGFNKLPEALDISHVNVAKYLEAADHILDYAIAVRPEPPAISTRRISLVNRGGFVAHIVMNGDGGLLQDKRLDPDFPPAAEQNHLDQGAHERWGSFDNGASVGLFRHEDESVSPYFIELVTIYPARYRVRTSLWSFQWDQGRLLPSRGTEAARLSVVQLTGDGRGGQHPSYVLGYFDAPDSSALEHEVYVWLNHNELIGFNTASLAPAANYYKARRAMEFTGPGITVDWLDIEGPLYKSWPPQSHTVLFGDLPIVEFSEANQPGVKPPVRTRPRQLGAGLNRPDPEPGVWTVQSLQQIADAQRLLGDFLPRLFRRPVADEVRQQYVRIVEERLAAGDCFELAMRAAFRTALVAPDFIYHLESADPNDQYALACRLSYFLWNSLPDDQLLAHAANGDLPQVLHAEVERLLQDPRSDRFISDFLGQWLKLDDIAANDPDRKLYPEFSPYLQDSMVAETRATFRELLDLDLDVSHLIQSDFVMINQKLATHYDIPGVTGTAMRRVTVPENCPRGGFLTQASILKITANGTTTSPVPRGAFVVDRLLGEPPEPPPSNVAAIEPDVRGTTTIREQLAKHRDHAVCASCHARIDPPGFALEGFDVISGFRRRYRSIGEGDPADRGSIDPAIGIDFRLGPYVDASGELPNGSAFDNIQQYQALISQETNRLLHNLATRLAVYSTGRMIRFSDRAAIETIAERTVAQGGGIRTLLHEVIGSPLFTNSLKHIDYRRISEPMSLPGRDRNRFLMTNTLSPVESPAQRTSPVTPAERPGTKYEFDGAHEIRLRLLGLFIPEQAESFRRQLEQFSEVRVEALDYEAAEVTLRYAAASDMFRNATPSQVVERLNDRIRQLSRGIFSVKPLGEVPHAGLERIEIPIVGLDCHACSLAVHDILTQVEGVEHATASFHDGCGVAWVNPAMVSRESLVRALRQRGVTINE